MQFLQQSEILRSWKSLHILVEIDVAISNYRGVTFAHFRNCFSLSLRKRAHFARLSDNCCCDNWVYWLMWETDHLPSMHAFISIFIHRCLIKILLLCNYSGRSDTFFKDIKITINKTCQILPLYRVGVKRSKGNNWSFSRVT